MKKWNFYTSKELRPCGWLKRQLEIQAEGLSGNLDKVWRDVRDSAWIGGEAEGWERVPYWLDGFIPLAYLLENDDMIERAKKYIDAIISYQKPSGWICPCDEEKANEYDTWAVQLISKALVVYYECSADERIPDVVYRIMRNYYELLSSGKIKLIGWGEARWFESFVAINFLLKRYGDEWISSLAKILEEQGTDYKKLYERWKRPLNEWRFDTHIVNLVMMLKYEAITCDALGKDYTDEAERLVTALGEYNGTPVGLFTGDECLSGLSPIQGTELCAVVEQMYSYEHLLAYTGESKWAQRLEVVAFNALPATISDDMWSHQYVQMSNQIACKRFPNKPIFRTNGIESHLFGLEPNYGCCTANFNQAWPKLSLSAFMHNGDTVFSAIPIPSSLKTDGVSVNLKTNYPFENKLEYTVEAEKDITLVVRIPAFAKNLTLDREEIPYSEQLRFNISAGECRTINIEFHAAPEIISRPYDLKSVRLGSLVFSIPIEYEKRMLEYVRDGVERKFPYCDYEYISMSKWNYGLSEPFFKAERREISEIPFDSHKPPVVLYARVKEIPWEFEDGYDNVCAKAPASRVSVGEEREITLYPYGCSKLRITELPFAE